MLPLGFCPHRFVYEYETTPFQNEGCNLSSHRHVRCLTEWLYLEVSEFPLANQNSFSIRCWYVSIFNPGVPNYFTVLFWVGRGTYGFMSVPKIFARNESQTCFSSIWTQITDSISYENGHSLSLSVGIKIRNMAYHYIFQDSKKKNNAKSQSKIVYSWKTLMSRRCIIICFVFYMFLEKRNAVVADQLKFLFALVLDNKKKCCLSLETM